MRHIVVPPTIECLARVAVDACFSVHNELGPGLLENAYEACLARELDLRGVRYHRQLEVPLEYKGIMVEVGFRADIVLEQQLLIELKAIDALLPVHQAQIITYLKLMKLPLGLLVNFNVPLIRDGINRVLNLHLSPEV